MEGAHFIKTGSLKKLSEQNLNDCSKSYRNRGCRGGLETWAFNYAKDYGLELGSDYPYVGKDDDCKWQENKA